MAGRAGEAGAGAGGVVGEDAGGRGGAGEDTGKALQKLSPSPAGLLSFLSPTLSSSFPPPWLWPPLHSSSTSLP